MLVRVEQTWLGGGVNAGLHYFNFPHNEFWSWPLQQFAVIFVIAAIAAAVGARRLEPAPLILFSASALMLFLGLVRSGQYYYFGPAYVLAVPAALWLLARSARVVPRLLPIAAVVALLVYVVMPQIHHARDASRVAQSDERQSAVMQADAAALLKSGQTALVDQEAPTPDSLYNSLVQNDVHGVPPPSQTRFFEDFFTSPDWLIAEHLRVSYYIGRRAVDVTKPESIVLLTGTYHVVPLPRYTRRDLNLGVLKLVSGPGITSPYKSLNAP